MYHNELQSNTANTSEKQTTFLDLNVSIEDGFVTQKLRRGKMKKVFRLVAIFTRGVSAECLVGMFN